MLEPGAKVPDFTLPDQTGTNRTLTDLTGTKGLVLYVYPKDNTSGCTLEAQEFRDNAEEFRKLGLETAGLSKDSVKSHANFSAKLQLGFPLLSDPETTLIQALGAWGEKKAYGRTSLGTVRSTFVLDANGRVRAVYPKVKAPGHAAQVLADLQAGAAGTR
ncbi:MAG: peroxiredoxin [Pseudomonadota bacterium]